MTVPGPSNPVPSHPAAPAGAAVAGAAPSPMEPRPFLDVPALLESSQPAARIPRLYFLVGGFLLVAMLSAAAASGPEAMRDAVRVMTGVVMLGLLLGLSGTTMYLVRRIREEQQAVESAGEFVQLRHWPQAAAVLEQYLSRPARTAQFRTQALVYLAAVLSRYHRFNDAIKVQEYLLESAPIDAATAHGLKLGRAMAMLREDHLFDADRAISDLRRSVPDGIDSAGLALVEIFRDVKTGHPDEAVELFERKLPALREQLGHRVADAYALAARAYDLQGRQADARGAFEKATLLAPPAELYRRYPEVEKLKDRYQPAVAPPEAA